MSTGYGGKGKCVKGAVKWSETIMLEYPFRDEIFRRK